MTLIMLVLLSTFAVLAMQLFRSSLLTIESAQNAQDQATRFDALLNRLHRDTWEATSMRIEPFSLELQRPEGMVRWQIAQDGTVQRSEAFAAYTWKNLNLNLMFEPRSAGAALCVGSGPTQQMIPLPSQVILTKGRP